MKSELPKVLHRLGSCTILERILDTAGSLDPDRVLVIVGYGREQIQRTLAEQEVEWVTQAEQRGTGHAVQQVVPLLTGFMGDILVINGDVPLLRSETLAQLVQVRRQRQPGVAALVANVGDPTGYGRVFCDEQGSILNIVEHRDCTPEQQQQNTINAGVYCFDWPSLAAILPQLKADNDQGEYYITDAVRLVNSAVAVEVQDPHEIGGINDRIQLAQAHQIWQQRLKHHWMRSGVTMIDPDSITLDDGIHLESDVILEPQTHLRGSTHIGQGSHIGPGCWIENSRIERECRVIFSTVTDSQIAASSKIGPYAHIRQQSQVGENCRIGNFVELKKTAMGSRTNAAHLSYLGDATLGEQVNIGAGTITANYDGVDKHSTIIGDRSKTGSNSVLVAPITLGSDVTVAAGSTLTESVADDCLVIARARQVVKPGWRLKRQSPHRSSQDPS